MLGEGDAVFLDAEVRETHALVYGSAKERDNGCPSKPHRTLESKRLKLSVTKQIVEGIRGEEFTSGFYDMTKWEEYRREKERYVCESYMFADPKHVERYGSCFKLSKARSDVWSRVRSSRPFLTQIQPNGIASTHNAFRAAGFTTPDISGEGLTSPRRRRRVSRPS